MGDGLQFAKAQKTAGAFNRMDGAENARQQLRVFGALFQLNHFLIQTGQVFIAFNQEFVNDLLVVHCLTLHPTPPCALLRAHWF